MLNKRLSSTALLLILPALMVTGCATKRYPIAIELSAAEASRMDCEDLELEILKIEETERKIDDTKGFNGKSVLGILGDFGIGNAMARGEAEDALKARRKSIREAQVVKNCMAPPVMSE